MSADITTLGLAVDSSQVNRARTDLDQMTQSGNKAADSASKMESAWGGFKSVMAGLALGATVVELVKIADSMSLMEARLKLVTGNAEDFAKAQAQVYAIAQKSNVGLEETAQLYTKLYDPVKRLGGGTKETGMIVEAFAASLRVGGASAQEAASATLQFAQAMGSGKLQGDEFRAIAEASPRFMKAMADGMGVPIEQLKKMGSEGKLTADVVGNALMKSLGQLKSEMAQMPDTVGGAMTRMKNDFKTAINDINKASGTTLGIAGAIEEARKLIPTIKDELVGAFQSVGDWIDSNKEGLQEVWYNAKALLGSVWEIVKAGGSFVGFITDAWVKSGALNNSWIALRYLVAGFSDGIEIVAAGFTKAGAILLGIIGYFSDAAKAASEAAHAAADETFKKFADGKSAVASLTAELKKHEAEQAKVKEAMAKTTAGAQDLTGKNKSLTDSVLDASGAHATLKNKHAELSKEQEQAKQRYTDLTQSIREHITQLDREQESGLKLNEAQKGLIKFKEELTDKYKNLTPEQKKSIEKLFEEWDAKIKVKEATDLLRQAEEDAWKQRQKDNEALWKKVEALQESVVKQQEENDKLKYTKEQLAVLEIARINDALRIAEETVAADELTKVCNEETEAHKATVEALKKLKAAKEEGVVLEAAKQARDEWQKISEEVGKSFTDSLMRAFESGKSFGQALMDSLKAMFKTTVLKLLIQPVMNSMNSAIGSLFGFGGGGGGLSGVGGSGTGGNLNWISNMAGGLGDRLTQFGQWMGPDSTIGGWANTAGNWLSGAGKTGASMFGNLGGGWTAGTTGMAAGNAAGTLDAANIAWSSGNYSGAIGTYGGMAASAIGGFMAGRGVGQMISGGYSAIGGQSGNSAVNTGAAVGAAIGSIIPGIGTMIGGLIGGALGGLVNRTFGHGAKEYNGDKGIEGTLGGTAGLSGGQAWADWTQKGGWFRSDKHGTDRFNMDQTTSDALAQGAMEVRKKTEDWAKALGLPAERFASVTTQFHVKLTDNETENQKVLAQLFADYATSLTNSYADLLKPFQLAGETLSDTAQRLTVIKQFSEGINEFGGIFSKVATLSIDAKTELMNFAGGMEAFIQKTAAFVDAYYTDSEKMGLTAKAIKEQLESMGLGNVNLSSRADFRALVESTDINTTAGRKLLDQLLTLAPTFASVGDYLEKNGGTLADLASKAPEKAILEALIKPQEAATQAIDATTDAVNVGNAILEAISTDIANGNGMLAGVLQGVLAAIQQGNMQAAEAQRILNNIEANGSLNGSKPSYKYDMAEPH